MESTQNPLVLTADTAKFITAVFEPKAYPITYENLRGAANPNPATYQEGTLVTFANPDTVTGYTFAGWTPSQITTDMTGSQTVRAAWTANGYSIAYDPNGGSGTMDATAATYDSEATVAANGFTWAGHVFAGWATNETGEVVYSAGQSVTNLTAQSSGVVTLYAVWEPLVVAAPTVHVDGGDAIATQDGIGSISFTADSCTVTLACATDGAVIYYSPKGATPKKTEANRYKEPITVSDTMTIKAIAVKEGVSSASVTVTVTKKTLTIEEAVSADAVTAALSWTTGGDSGAKWKPMADATAQTGFSAWSGEVGDDAAAWLKVSVTGKGTLTFRYRVSCEEDPDGTFTWDRLEVYADEAARRDLWLDGESGWRSGTIEFATAGSHSVKWVYFKDESDLDGDDCAWVSGVTWTPSGAADGLEAWLAERNLSADSKAANGRTAAECYALGLDPALATDDFRIISFRMEGNVPKVEWEPKSNRWTGKAIEPKLKGKAKLTDGGWVDVPADGNPALRFFKVTVEVP